MQQTMIVSKAPSRVLYKVAGVMAVFIVLAGLTDVITSMGLAVQDNRTIPIVEWFTLFQNNRFEAFSRLGVINMITLSSCIPVYLAFNQAFRKQQPATTVPTLAKQALAKQALAKQALVPFATIVFLTGTAVYLSSNTVFALFAVSEQYAAASAAQRPLLEVAGHALLMQGADLTPGTFFGLFLTQIANLLITSAMLRGSVFGKWTGRAGFAGFGLMSIFFILTAFFPTQYDSAMRLAAPGGLILMAYQIMLARKFFQLGQ